MKLNFWLWYTILMVWGTTSYFGDGRIGVLVALSMTIIYSLVKFVNNGDIKRIAIGFYVTVGFISVLWFNTCVDIIQYLLGTMYDISGYMWIFLVTVVVALTKGMYDERRDLWNIL